MGLFGAHSVEKASSNGYAWESLKKGRSVDLSHVGIKIGF